MKKKIFQVLLLVISLLPVSCGVFPTPSIPADSDPVVSREILFTHSFHSRNGSGSNILAIRSDGSDPRQVTADGQNWNRTPCWSPDRSQIAYLSHRSGSLQLHIMDKDGGNDRQLTSVSNLEAWNVLWLPDGNQIAIRRVVNGEWLWEAVNILTGEITSLDEWAFDGGYVSLSHDGTRIAYIALTNQEELDSPAEIYIQDIDGSNLYQLTSTGWIIENPVWSLDDSQITFLSSSEYGPGQNAIYTINLAGSNLHELIITDLSPVNIAWSPDGKSLAVIAGEMQPTGDLFDPERRVYTLYTLNTRTGEKTILYKVTEPDLIMNLSW